ncbi:exosome complex exonuclease RRP44 homolog A [Olea europaea subsp. europaea]|uniref:Exosome complex exonuclease RRP44 homolog A n=1 Tax=Olea europaea subsp. europaea TaxID=158383 RepID=A0A8S0TP09_OLEEU|nr:exosome complex exonuclease RRP44 homolog A [Olea europaea subsp. europaea]
MDSFLLDTASALRAFIKCNNIATAVKMEAIIAAAGGVEVVRWWWIDKLAAAVAGECRELQVSAVSWARPANAEARIVKLRSNCFIVFVPKFGIEGPVYLMPGADKMVEWFIDEQN